MTEEGGAARGASARAGTTGRANAHDPRIIALSLAGASLDEIAQAAGVSVSTIQRRLACPEVIDQLADERRRLLERMVGQLGSSTRTATARLVELVAHEDPNVALKAIGLLLGQAFKGIAALDQSERIARMEEQLALVLSEGRDPSGGC